MGSEDGSAGKFQAGKPDKRITEKGGGQKQRVERLHDNEAWALRRKVEQRLADSKRQKELREQRIADGRQQAPKKKGDK